MGYVIAGLLVVLIVGAAVAAFWLAARARGREQRGAAGDEVDGSATLGGGASIAAVDKRSPVGDTSEHAGEHRDGRTVAEPGGQPPPDTA